MCSGPRDSSPTALVLSPAPAEPRSCSVLDTALLKTHPKPMGQRPSLATVPISQTRRQRPREGRDPPQKVLEPESGPKSVTEAPASSEPLYFPSKVEGSLLMPCAGHLFPQNPCPIFSYKAGPEHLVRPLQGSGGHPLQLASRGGGGGVGDAGVDAGTEAGSTSWRRWAEGVGCRGRQGAEEEMKSTEAGRRAMGLGVLGAEARGVGRWERALNTRPRCMNVTMVQQDSSLVVPQISAGA